MTKGYSHHHEPLIATYLSEPQSLNRLQLLTSMKKQGVSIPLDLASDLMLLELPNAEKQAILAVTNSTDALEFEKFLTDHLPVVSQELAVSLVNTWTAKSQHILAHRLQKVALARHTPQRVRYTILSSAGNIGAEELLKGFTQLEGLEELSQAFHALLLEKAVSYGIEHPRYLKLAKTICVELREELHPSNKALSAALYYYARFHNEELESLRRDQFLSPSWHAIVQSLDLSGKEWPKKVEAPKAGFSVDRLITAKYANFAKEDEKTYLNEDSPRWSIHRLPTSDRQHFFDVFYRGVQHANAEEIRSEPWKALSDSLKDKSDTQMDRLMELSEQNPGVFRLCFYNVLGSFTSQDRAVLRILGQLRTTEEHELDALIQTLGDISSPRAGQELLKLILRPNLGATLQVKIVRNLERMSTTGLQNELRGAIAEIQTLQISGAEKDELTESLTSLLVSSNSRTNMPAASLPANAAGEEKIAAMIPNFHSLSGEVKRALRTGQFFHSQVLVHQNSSSIDLSPVIDMQYKAIEIYLRESFENMANQLIHDGVLQRKLDIIGYARPIPEKMTAFENQLGNQPIVREIPFFSKFKLRKMLRGLCQFKPGKRFTLDGLKAFSLFFLCFSRKKCSYGLANLMPLPFPTDNQLATFCKQLHVFQDFRNRAVHEGLPPGAANDIERTWAETAEIINQVSNMNIILEHMRTQTTTPSKAVVIERKGA